MSLGSVAARSPASRWASSFLPGARLGPISRTPRPLAGASAYSRNYDYARMRAIADSVGAYLMSDMAHIRRARGLACAARARDVCRRLPSHAWPARMPAAALRLCCARRELRR